MWTSVTFASVPGNHWYHRQTGSGQPAVTGKGRRIRRISWNQPLFCSSIRSPDSFYTFLAKFPWEDSTHLISRKSALIVHIMQLIPWGLDWHDRERVKSDVFAVRNFKTSILGILGNCASLWWWDMLNSYLKSPRLQFHYHDFFRFSMY